MRGACGYGDGHRPILLVEQPHGTEVIELIMKLIMKMSLADFSKPSLERVHMPAQDLAGSHDSRFAFVDKVFVAQDTYPGRFGE